MAVLVAAITVSIEVFVDFKLECAAQHSLRSSQAELVQSAPRFLIVPFRMDLDYVLPLWRVLPLRPQGPRLIALKRKNTLPVSNPRSTFFGYNSYREEMLMKRKLRQQAAALALSPAE